MKIATVAKLLGVVCAVELVGGIGGLFTGPAISSGWYAALQKPSWNPPAWLFGPVWVTLYALMGVAAFLIWQKGLHKRNVRGALTIFGVQLVLNAAWSAIFFGLKSPGWAFVDLAFLWVLIVATIAAFAKISRPAAWLLVPYILWVSFAGFLNYSIWQLNSGSFGQTACTMEARLCPDGSSVGRSGPSCEFARCAEPTVDPSWKTATDGKTGITFRYPETLGTTYMRAFDWPPQVQVVDGPFTCVEAGSEVQRAGRTELRMAGGQQYCVTTIVEGAAGSMYTQYAYATDRSPKVLIFTATVQAVQCGNYDDPQKTVCEQEREAFDFDSVMDRVIQTVTFAQ